MASTTALMSAIAAVYMAQAVSASLHSGDPGTDGSNEISGVTRVAVTWTDNGDGTFTSNQLTFAVTAGTTVAQIGLWDSSGNYLDSIVQAAYFSSDGTFNATISGTTSLT